MRVRNFCFTINNYTEEDVRMCNEIVCTYIVYGYEQGENNTPHLQGYIYYQNKKEWNVLKREIPRAHIEICRGTSQDNIQYCKKEGNFVERGEPPKQGNRVDIHRVIRECENGANMRHITQNARNLQGIQIAEKWLKYNEDVRDFQPEVIWLWGPSGVGKSRTARELAEGDIYTKNDGSKWWEGYDAHETVILDDFRDSWWSITETLRILDRYECRIECKGGSRQLLARKIIITSIFPPHFMYRNAAGEPIEQLLRRITTVTELRPELRPEVDR